MKQGRDAFCFFDNTDKADDAVRDALEMRELLTRPTSKASDILSD
jgi:uncharacterized protein YecE (DUF72 family)